MEFATITPSKGDRPELLEFCRHQLQRMTLKPSKSYFIINQTSKYPDLVERVKTGIKRALQDGFEFVYIIEDDDYYNPTYFEQMQPKEDDCFVGSDRTTYYSLRNNTWQTMQHTGRSSLYNTGFNLTCSKYFDWPDDNAKFLDIKMWEFAMQKGLKKRFIPNGSIGIKHGIGQVLGKGHDMVMPNKDEYREWLKKNVDPEAFMFYSQLKVK